MEAPSSSARPKLTCGFCPSSWPHNHTLITEQRSSMPATSLQVNTRRPHDCMTIPNISSNGLPSFCNSYSPNMPLFGSQGDLVRAPSQQEIDNAPLVQSEPDTNRPPKPLGKLLVHAKVVHTPGAQMRILRLSKREQAIVLTDGGNTVESQLRVLDTIERYSPDRNDQRVWTEARILLSSGKETIEYRCKAPGCDYHDVKFQKARQHFVSCHVAEACWGCPIEGCTHIGKYKRLDDLKHHHMVPCHGVEYTRNKKRDTSEHPTDASTPGQAPHPTNPTSPLPEGQVSTVATITTPSQVQDQAPASLHTSSQAERAPKKVRQARLLLSARPSQVSRYSLGRAVVSSETTSGHGRGILVGTEASSSTMPYPDTTSSGVAPPANVYLNVLSPQSHSHQQTPPWPNHSMSPAYVGTSLVPNPYSPEALSSTYVQPSHSPLGSLLDSISAYIPQGSAYGDLSMPTAPQEGSYVHAPMTYAPSPLRSHPDPNGMASGREFLPLSPQGDRNVGTPLRGRVTDASHLSRQYRSNSQVDRVQDDLSFGGRSNLTAPGTQTLVPGPYYNQWGQTGAGLPTHSLSHQLSSPTNMATATLSPAYITPSQPPSRTLRALSSDRSTGRDQTLSSVRYAPPPQRVSAPTYGLAENGGYLSAEWSGSHSVGVASPKQDTIYHDRMQALHESMMAYQAQSFDGFETPSPHFGWSPQSGYPHATLSTNLYSSDSRNSYLQSTSAWTETPNF